MLSLITIVHITVALLLVLIVLVQGGKGADLGAGFGGASQTVFGSTGGATFFSKFTAWLAAIFMLSSLTLAYLSAHRTAKSVIPKKLEQPAGMLPNAAVPPAAPATQPSGQPVAPTQPVEPAQQAE